MKILITGSSGFIGSHLVEHFISRRFKVVAFDRYNSNNDLGWLDSSKYKNKINFVLGDIRDYDSVHKSMQGCDVVIHLAALIGIPYSYLSPTAYVKTNIEGTLNILEAAKNLKIKQIIITSTSEVYGSSSNGKLKEIDELKAQSPYSASKIAADQLSLSFFRSFNLPIKIIRPFNTFGPRQSARAVIPTILIQALTTQKIKIGNINAIRDFLYVSDLCLAYEKILKNKKLVGEIINVGAETEISVKDLIKKISHLTKLKLKIVIEKKRIRPTKSEVTRLKCDNSKLKKYTDWKVNVNLETGIKYFIEWLKKDKNLNHYKADKYNI